MARQKGIDMTARGYRNLSAAMDEILNARTSISRGELRNGSKKLNLSVEERQEYNREATRRMRAARGARQLNCDMGVEGLAAMLYLQKQWGFKSRKEAVNVALRFLALQTRKGLERIDLDIAEDGT